MDDHLRVCDKFEDLCNALDQKCLIMAPFCGGVLCEEQIKTDSAR